MKELRSLEEVGGKTSALLGRGVGALPQAVESIVTLWSAPGLSDLPLWHQE